MEILPFCVRGKGAFKYMLFFYSLYILFYALWAWYIVRPAVTYFVQILDQVEQRTWADLGVVFFWIIMVIVTWVIREFAAFVTVAYLKDRWYSYPHKRIRRKS